MKNIISKPSHLSFTVFCLLVFCVYSFASAGQIRLNVSLFPAGSFVAKSESLKGEVVLTESDGWLAKDLVVNLKTLTTGISLRDEHMIENYFEAGKPGNAEAVMSKAIGKGGVFQGKLRVHGVEKHVEGRYQLEGTQLKATFQVKSSDFKIKKAEYKGLGVEDEVKVEAQIAVSAKKAGKPRRSK